MSHSAQSCPVPRLFQPSQWPVRQIPLLSSFCRRGNGLRGPLAGVVVISASTKYFPTLCLWHKAGRRVLTPMLGVAL